MRGRTILFAGLFCITRCDRHTDLAKSLKNSTWFQQLILDLSEAINLVENPDEELKQNIEDARAYIKDQAIPDQVELVGAGAALTRLIHKNAAQTASNDILRVLIARQIFDAGLQVLLSDITIQIETIKSILTESQRQEYTEEVKKLISTGNILNPGAVKSFLRKVYADKALPLNSKVQIILIVYKALLGVSSIAGQCQSVISLSEAKIVGTKLSMLLTQPPIATPLPIAEASPQPPIPIKAESLPK